MKRDHEAVQYVKKKMKGFNQRFTDCVIRCLDRIDRIHDYCGCMSNSVSLYICAKVCGYNPELCYGLCELQGKKFYHAWLEVNEIIIDPSIYGNVNFHENSPWDKIATPYIGPYNNTFMKYGKFVLDEEWKNTSLSLVEGMTLSEYVQEAPEFMIQRNVYQFLGVTPAKLPWAKFDNCIKNVKIERK